VVGSVVVAAGLVGTSDSAEWVAGEVDTIGSYS